MVGFEKEIMLLKWTQDKLICSQINEIYISCELKAFGEELVSADGCGMMNLLCTA